LTEKESVALAFVLSGICIIFALGLLKEYHEEGNQKANGA
jgi:hypothetical protein